MPHDHHLGMCENSSLWPFLRLKYSIFIQNPSFEAFLSHDRKPVKQRALLGARHAGLIRASKCILTAHTRRSSEQGRMRSKADKLNAAKASLSQHLWTMRTTHHHAPCRLIHQARTLARAR